MATKAAEKPRKAAAPRTKRRKPEDIAIEQAQRFAALLADAPAESNDPLAPPALIEDPRLAGALQVWRDRAPGLARLGCLTGNDRLTFALLCVYAADFAAAMDEVLTNGFAIAVPTVSGGVMMRENPAVRRRDHAASMVLDLSGRFGMSPLDRYRLFGVRGRVAGAELDRMDGELFERPAAPVAAKTAGAHAKAEDGEQPRAPAASRWDQLLDRGPAKPN